MNSSDTSLGDASLGDVTPFQGVTTLSRLTHDPKNANRGTARGLEMLRASLEKLGAGRSLVLDRAGRIIAGNKTASAAALAGMDDVIVVRTDGSKIVAVQRTDLDLDSPEGRELALADNRVGELGLSWDRDVLAELQTSLDLSGLFAGGEIDALLAGLGDAPDLVDGPDTAGWPGAAGGTRIDGPGALPAPQAAHAGAPAGSEEGPPQAPAPGAAPARPLGPQGAPSLPSPQDARPPGIPVRFKEFDESVADGVTVHQCPACGNRWAA